MRRTLSAVLIPLVLASTSCSLFSPHTQAITVVPSDPRAEVYVDGKLLGTGVQTPRLDKSEKHSVLAKCGQSAGSATVAKTISVTGVLDIAGGVLFLIPLVGLLSPGAWELSPTTLDVAIPDASGCRGPATAQRK